MVAWLAGDSSPSSSARTLKAGSEVGDPRDLAGPNNNQNWTFYWPWNPLAGVSTQAPWFCANRSNQNLIFANGTCDVRLCLRSVIFQVGEEYGASLVGCCARRMPHLIGLIPNVSYGH